MTTPTSTTASSTTARSPLIPPTPSATEYLDEAGRPLDDIFARKDPLALFRDWLADATRTEPNDPNAVAVATVDARGMPDVRMVLLKDFGPDGFVFYSHRDGTKGRQMVANPRAAMCFHWKTQKRQVRLRGRVEFIEGSRADSYFAGRARLSRIGAHASRQSRELESYEALRAEVSRLDAEFGDAVPRPADWHGFAVVPDEMEFWRDRPFRLHDRLRFARPDPESPAQDPNAASADSGWTRTRLYP